MAPIVPAPAEVGPMLYGHRKYQLGFAAKGQQMVYSFDDDTCKAEIRLMPDCAPVRDTMREGTGRVLATAELECGGYLDDIEILAEGETLDLLRKSIEWFYAGTDSPEYRKPLRVFYTRVLHAQA